MIRAFKASSDSPEVIPLDRDAIRRNHRNGRQTNILFDTNILITIENAYRTDHRHKALKDAGVLELTRLIERNGKFGVFISPAAAYQELPPSRRRQVESAFEVFLKDYLPKFRDDPNSVKVSFEGVSEHPETFRDLLPDRQRFISCSYASLLAINVINSLKGLDGAEKFVRYMDYCCEVLDLMSLKELTIARYAFAPETGVDEELRKRKVAVAGNFLKLKKGADKGLARPEKLKRIALNGANDLKLIAAADTVNNSRERIGSGVVQHDAWIATGDEKLYEFCCACPGFAGSEAGGPMARFVDTHADISGTRYWRDTTEMQQRRLMERSAGLEPDREMDLIVSAALEVENKLGDEKADEYFESRSWRSQR